MIIYLLTCILTNRLRHIYKRKGNLILSEMIVFFAGAGLERLLVGIFMIGRVERGDNEGWLWFYYGKNIKDIF